MWFSLKKETQYDSWLTIGITGDAKGKLSSIVIKFDASTEKDGITCTDCVVFWLNPTQTTATANNAFVVGQITVPKGSKFELHMGASGHLTGAHMARAWRDDDIVWHN